MSNEKYVQGMAVRREVLGDEYVDKAISSAADFVKPLQDFVAENEGFEKRITGQTICAVNTRAGHLSEGE